MLAIQPRLSGRDVAASLEQFWGGKHIVIQDAARPPSSPVQPIYPILCGALYADCFPSH
jgi:hypothetical protein